MKALVVVVMCVAALVLPASALAARCAPPGNSGVSQYFETVPGASCNQAPPGSGASHGGGHGGSLPAGTSHQLSEQGATGKAVAKLVASTGTANVSSSHPASSGGTGAGAKSSGQGRHLSGSTPNPVSALLHPIVTGSTPGGVGIALPLILVGAVVLLAAIALVRRRGPGQNVSD